MIVEIREILALIEKRMEEVKSRLCNPNMDQNATQIERGKYVELRNLHSEFSNKAANT